MKEEPKYTLGFTKGASHSNGTFIDDSVPFVSGGLFKEKGFIAWDMTEECNFHCRYCSNPGSKNVQIQLPIHRILETLNQTGIDWTMGLTGGEPFMYPKFVELCKIITQSYQLSIDTNLSNPSLVKNFSETIEPRRVDYIYASTHILDREKKASLDDFLDSVLFLKNKNFKIIVNYVFHPLVIDRFERDYELFKSNGIRLEPKALKGEYEGKIYPKAYSSREKELLLKYNPLADRSAPFLSKGLKCNAGKLFALIETDGTVVRCTADKTEFGSIFRGVHLNQSAEPCSVTICPCNGQHLIVESEKLEIQKRILF